jgi:hypothetical protein
VSGRGIPGKLGVKPGDTLMCVDAPPALESVLAAGDAPDADTTLVFVRDRAAAAAAIPTALARFVPGQRLWFAYPKRSGAHASDISRDTGWEPLAEADFLAVTQVALDNDWSALRFRPRTEIKRLTRASERA